MLLCIHKMCVGLILQRCKGISEVFDEYQASHRENIAHVTAELFAGARPQLHSVQEDDLRTPGA